MAFVHKTRALLERSNTNLSGIGGSYLDRALLKTELQLSLPGLSTPIPFEAYCLRHLGLSTPTVPPSPTTRDQWKNLNLADKGFDLPGPVDLLIGVNLLPALLRSGLIRKADLIAQQTAVRWTIFGRTTPNSASPINSCSALLTETEPWWHRQLMNRIQQFWEMENLSSVVWLASEVQLCEKRFSEHCRTSEGRYIVRLPTRGNITELLGESLSSAIGSLKALHRRMQRNSDLARAYLEFMSEYKRLGHMRELNHREASASLTLTHYLPHHGIWQREDQGSKLQVVFDASRPTSTGCSFNDALMTGPKLQTNLWQVLTRWRQHRFAFCTDIRMMHRQIRIDDRDVDIQRIVWCANEQEPLRHYQLLTVTYGQSCSPYLALRVLEQLCIDEGDDKPEAVSALTKDRYIDDVLTGADDLESALGLRDQLRRLLTMGGFQLRKWIANNSSLLQDLPAEECLRPSWFRISEEGPVNELGILWDPTNDSFRLTQPTIAKTQNTKREVLSAISSLFDPCGWLAPVTVIGKMVMQDLWRAKLDWDQELPSSMARRWNDFKENLSHIPSVDLPRWTRYGSHRQVQLHAFSDASRRVMAAAVYVRVTSEDNQVTTTLLAAKTKLNAIRGLQPSLKPEPRMTIPRLELRAALLACKLLRTIATDLQIATEECFAWSDAQIVDRQLRWSHSRADAVRHLEIRAHPNEPS